MSNLNKQFDPFTQAEQRAVELDLWIQEGRALLDRTSWILQKMQDENERLRAERDELEIYTEAEAAALLRVSDWTLGDLRRRHNFEHIANGKICYTRKQLLAIVEALKVGSKKAEGRKLKAA